MEIKIAPSLLSADFSSLESEIKKVERAGADMLHIDIMDGHFVSNITIGPAVIESIRGLTKLPFDTHLMIENPQKLARNFVRAGSDMITAHIEATGTLKFKALARDLKRQGVKVGVSLNPKTPLEKIKDVLGIVDLVLVMSVNPGFSGQEFLPEVIPKIRNLRAIFKGDIAVDGGVKDTNAGMLIKAGANILASGSYIFGAKDTKKAIERIRNAR
ncbi:MAG: ribulose-phosphate 3-epimerase [Candidatus Omnitrophica bacterium]|nr:ribulose-phosphate 3-epimerase [Candidatus Omnitrophota bacterium]